MTTTTETAIAQVNREAREAHVCDAEIPRDGCLVRCGRKAKVKRLTVPTNLMMQLVGARITTEWFCRKHNPERA